MTDRYASFEALKITRDGNVLTVMLDNPPLNAMTPRAHFELGTIWAVAGADPQVRVIVLTGGGDRAFCAGGDLNGMVENWGDRERWANGMAEARDLVVGMLECPKPVIARINGHAMGLGASIALGADITIAVEDAKIGDSHVVVGLATGDGGALLWPVLTGLTRARKFLLAGEPISGKQAAEYELITQAVPRDGLDEAVQYWVDSFLKKSPSALQTTKQALNAKLVDDARKYMPQMLALETVSWESPNHLEAVKAMLEKREPSFIDE